MKHTIKDCPYKKHWLSNNQKKDKMFNSNKSQICKDCKPLNI